MNEEHEEQLAAAFLAFTKLERTLRRIVGEALSTHFGMQWDKQIPTDVRETLEANRYWIKLYIEILDEMKEASEGDYGPEREKNLLAFADFSHLTVIVNYLWDQIFHLWFSDKQFAMGRFEEIRLYRNALMHSVLLPKQCPTFISLCQRLTEQLEAGPKENVFYQKVLTVLNEMTGLFEGERDVLLEHIERNLGRCTPTLLEQIRHKFIKLPDTHSKIDALASRLQI